MAEKPETSYHDEDHKQGEVVSEDTVRVQNAQLAAIIATHKPNPLGRGYLKLYAVCVLIFLASTMNVSMTCPAA